MIDGLRVVALRQIDDPRGRVMHMLRADSPDFERFGEIYFSCVRAGAVKAWRRHRVMTVNLAVVSGAVQVVAADGRAAGSEPAAVFKTVLSPDGAYALLTIPPGVWYGFRGVASGESVLANCSTHPHDPAEIERLPQDDPVIPYRWPPA